MQCYHGLHLAHPVKLNPLRFGGCKWFCNLLRDKPGRQRLKVGIITFNRAQVDIEKYQGIERFNWLANSKPYTLEVNLLTLHKQN